MSATTQPPRPSALRRELGRWDLTAIGVNQVIGGAVFAQPALSPRSAGAWSPWMVAAVGVASMLIALSFAEVGSRFEGTGGPYLYTRAAFGRFAAFEVGWMLWFTRAASWAAVINVLASSLGFYWPRSTTGVAARRRDHLDHRSRSPRSTFAASARAASSSTSLTVGKLLPLRRLHRRRPVRDRSRRGSCRDRALTLADLSASGLLLIFAFGGYEVVPVVAGETPDPRRDGPVRADHDDRRS